jgi:hypothetical protein
LSVAGADYVSVVGSQPADRQSAIRKAARHANHLQVGWRPIADDDPLTLPDIESYDSIAPSLVNVFRNVILIAEEADVVPTGKRLPVNHAATSLRQFFDRMDPSVPTDIHVVTNAIEYLKHCEALGPPAFKIKHFFSFSHGWDMGIKLINYDEPERLPYIREDGDSGPQIHNQAVYEMINFIYGEHHRGPEEPRPPGAGEFFLPFGSNDETEIKTNQFRVSNLRYLPELAKQYMQLAFSETVEVIFAGCNVAGTTPAVTGCVDWSFAGVFAQTVRRSTRGTIFNSNVFVFKEAQGKWVKANITREDPAPAEPLIITAGSEGVVGDHWDKFWTDQTGHPTVPDTPNLLEAYRLTLAPCEFHPDK